MFNNPSGDLTKIGLGPGILLIGPTGSTPTTDMGYVKGGATITIERSMTEIRQGSPQTIVAGLANKEDMMIEFSGIEWNLENMLFMIGAGATSATNPNDFLKFGGNVSFAAKALRFQHKMPDGSTVFVDLWKCLPDGQLQISANEADSHEMKYKFKAMYAGTTDWGGATLTDGQALGRITRQRA